MTPDPASKLLDWYAEHQRDLPWRRSHDPYAVWVSEIMLQQTRVETVLAYYKRWIAQFPTIESLAEARIDEVLSLWEGLGYYRRAHYLHQAAQLVVIEHEGELPHSIDDLRKLPGIGHYTAAAIAAIAFNEDTIALDGNLRRVLARFFDVEIDVQSPAGERLLIEKALTLLPAGRASDFNQALMDLGAQICTPQSPNCDQCPLQEECLGFQRGVQKERPVKKARPEVPHLQRALAVVEREGRLLIGKRPEGKLLGGMWEFPSGFIDEGEPLEGALERVLLERVGLQAVPERQIGAFDHAYTHYKVTAHAFLCRAAQGEAAARHHVSLAWVSPQELSDYPMGKIDRSVAQWVQTELAE